MADFSDILKKIEKSVESFNRSIPGIQKDVLDAIQEDLQKLDIQSGKIKATVKNLSLIARIKNRINKIILTDGYKDEVKKFAKAFNEITVLQNQYWTQIESEFTPRPLLKAIKIQAIEDTVAKLTEGGITANISDKLVDILKTATTSGGSYSSLTDQLRESLTTTKTPGSLERYVRTITTDSLNTYNATYTRLVSSDLGFEWYKYSNTLITTSRPFCQSLIEERNFFHVSEIAALLRAENMYYTDENGQRKKVELYQRTGLPAGMKAETTVENFLDLRGGWQCGHQCRPVSEGLVPQNVKERVFATVPYVQWKAAQEV